MLVQEWPYEIGETVLRRSIHEKLGGQWQSGIVTPRLTTDILVFTDPEAGAAYGYDRFEGQREDGTYSYTGQGQEGNQVFRLGNKALSEAAEHGRVIRLFRTRGTMATYVGEFTTADPPYSIQRIPDVTGAVREGIVFNLLPIRADMRPLPAYGGVRQTGLLELDWVAPPLSDIEIEVGAAKARHESMKISREEFRLQAIFGNWLHDQGLRPKRLQLPADGVILEPDFYVPAPKNWIVEAKRSPSRNYVRSAIGQVLDYVEVASQHGTYASPAILLPGRPSDSLQRLLQRHKITLIVNAGENDFEIIEC